MIYMMEQSNKFTPHEIESEKWLMRAEADSVMFLNAVSQYAEVDLRGIKGDSLFSLTLDNQDSIHTKRQVVTGDTTVNKGMFLALCPELETFVTLINWLGPDEDRNTERLRYYRELQRFSKANQNKICELVGNYRLKLQEYATVIIFRAEVGIKEKTKMFYEWERAPFLKRSAENFAYFPSPVFMSPMRSQEKNVSEDKASYFTVLFKIKGFSNNIVTVRFYPCTNRYLKDVDIVVYDEKLLESLKEKVDASFIGLFEDKIYRSGGCFQREFVLLNISSEIDGNELAGHLISQRMYYNYLRERQLLICSNADFQNRCRMVFSQIKRDYSKEVTMPFDFFVKTYLEAYFVQIDGNWYYKPFILKNITDDEFREFLSYLSFQGKIGEHIAMLEFIRKYNSYKKSLLFLNAYNFYSKRTLIDKIRNYNDLEGVSKWRM